MEGERSQRSIINRPRLEMRIWHNAHSGHGFLQSLHNWNQITFTERFSAGCLGGKPALCCYDAWICPHAKTNRSIDRTGCDAYRRQRAPFNGTGAKTTSAPTCKCSHGTRRTVCQRISAEISRLDGFNCHYKTGAHMKKGGSARWQTRRGSGRRRRRMMMRGGLGSSSDSELSG